MYAEGGGEKIFPSSRSNGDVTVVHDCAIPVRQFSGLSRSGA